MLKERLGDRWRRRSCALSRLRWVAKHRILREARFSPLEHAGYVLLDPEVAGGQHERHARGDLSELSGVPADTLAGYVAEGTRIPTSATGWLGGCAGASMSSIVRSSPIDLDGTC